MQFLFANLCTLAAVGLYGYVVLAQLRAEYKATGGFSWMGFTKAAVWPLTIWNTIEKLYLSGRPFDKVR